MVGTKIKISLLILFFGLMGCSKEMESTELVDFLTAFDFENGNQDWEGGISDYPIDYKESSDYLFTNVQIPSNLPLEGSGLKISAENPHGDLFYFFKRKISGLKPNKKYRLDFEFLVYTQLLTQPDKLSSEELYLKIGAVNYKPELKQITWQNSLEYMSLNVDKGVFNNESGEDIVNIGSVKELTSNTPEAISGNTFDFLIEVESNKDGVVWLVTGVDSGVKSQLTFGMAALTVYFREKN